MRKWIDREDCRTEPAARTSANALDLIASESRRCGDLVKNLLTFSRTSPMNLQPTDLNTVVEPVVAAGRSTNWSWRAFKCNCRLDRDLPRCIAIGAQIEQVLLALMMNAIDAMPQGGNLWLTSRCSAERECGPD